MSTAARIDELRKKFEENPRRYFAPLANELRKAGDLSQAIALCREHLPKQPGHMSGYIVFGQALYESAELDEARRVFEQALALDPENLIALHHLGHIARQQGDTAAARRWYERALETDPRNDDIAHQLATLATPVRPQTSIPTPVSQAAVLEGMSPADRAVAELAMLDLGAIPARRDLGAIPTPPFPQAAVGALPPTPTPDAALRAVDFDVVNAGLQQPGDSTADRPTVAALDLDAIESVGQRVESVLEPLELAEPIDLSFDEIDPVVVPSREAEAVAETSSPSDPAVSSGPAMADDPFAFADGPIELDTEGQGAAQIDLEASFEEGLVAETWPDTTELMQRAPTPRSTTPVSVEIPAEAVEAFGREPMDPMVLPLPEPEPEVLGDEADLVAVESMAAEPVVAEPVMAEPVMAEVFAAEGAIPVTASQEVEDVVSDADPREELPWLATPTTPTEEVSAIAGALEADARASGEPEIVSMFTTTEVDDGSLAAAYESAPESESSFADLTMPASPVLHGDEVMEGALAGAEAAVAADTGDEQEVQAPAADAQPAFVTETMGELLVAQGFTDRAIAVYEELVRRRPYDPVLAARLAELQESQAAPAVAVPTYTARERFAALAARRVSRRTPPYATPSIGSVAAAAPTVPTPRYVTPVRGTPVAATPIAPTPISPIAAMDSLADLFGVDAPVQDDQAAQALAQAFAPEQVDRAAVTDSFPAAFFGGERREPTPAYGAVRQPTPVRAPTPVAPRAVVPPAAESTGEFSFDRFFPDPAVSTPGNGAATPVTPAPAAGGAPGADGTPASPAAPAATDDLAQFSAWLKGLGNS